MAADSYSTLVNALLTFSNDQVLYENLPDEVRRVCRQAAEQLQSNGPHSYYCASQTRCERQCGECMSKQDAYEAGMRHCGPKWRLSDALLKDLIEHRYFDQAIACTKETHPMIAAEMREWLGHARADLNEYRATVESHK